jgi:small-conductance mechanosensitive channel
MDIIDIYRNTYIIHISGDDEIIIRIPNAQLVNQRFSNLSRLFKCQVKQSIRLSYDDIGMMDKIVQAIRYEIKASCPKLILDGSRPFRVHWREFKDDHLEIVVDCHFNLPPTGNIYWVRICIFCLLSILSLFDFLLDLFCTIG